MSLLFSGEIWYDYKLEISTFLGAQQLATLVGVCNVTERKRRELSSTCHQSESDTWNNIDSISEKQIFWDYSSIKIDIEISARIPKKCFVSRERRRQSHLKNSHIVGASWWWMVAGSILGSYKESRRNIMKTNGFIKSSMKSSYRCLFLDFCRTSLNIHIYLGDENTIFGRFSICWCFVFFCAAQHITLAVFNRNWLLMLSRSTESKLRWDFMSSQ